MDITRPRCHVVVRREEIHCNAEMGIVTHKAGDVEHHHRSCHAHPARRTRHDTCSVCLLPVPVGGLCASHPNAKPRVKECKALLRAHNHECGEEIHGDGKGCPKHPGRGARYFG